MGRAFRSSIATNLWARAPAAHARALALAVLATAAAIALTGCADPGSQWMQRRLYSMGTWVDITLEAPNARAGQAALEDVEQMLRRFEVDYYAWGNGELTRVNDAIRDGREITVSAGLARLLDRAQRLSARSEGTFDPAVGALVELWGFNSATAPHGTPPAPAAIEAWLASGARIAALRIDGRRVSSDVAGIELDLGGIAKGEAVDRALDLLRRDGIHNALVNAGGDIRVIGQRGGRAWRVGIKAPRGDGLLGIIELDDGEGAFTSGDYERYYDIDGRRMHHIMDPRTGYPAAGTRAITVIARDGVAADAAATALFVAGADRWSRIARARGVDLVLRVDAAGVVQVTQGMRQRLDEDAAAGADVVAVDS